jgi:hypothetical protein
VKNLETPGDVADYLAKIAAQGLKEKYEPPPTKAGVAIQPKRGRGRPKGSKNKMKWVAKKSLLASPPKPAKIQANPQVVLELRATHNINGMLYGPGPVKVPANLAQSLQEQEQRAIQYDETWRDEKAYLIQPGNRGGSSMRLNRVSPSMFETAMGVAQPI